MGYEYQSGRMVLLSVWVIFVKKAKKGEERPFSFHADRDQDSYNLE